jgi:hypothetical protein
MLAMVCILDRLQHPGHVFGVLVGCDRRLVVQRSVVALGEARVVEQAVLKEHAFTECGDEEQHRGAEIFVELEPAADERRCPISERREGDEWPLVLPARFGRESGEPHEHFNRSGSSLATNRTS